MNRKASTRTNPYHAQYILRRRDDYLELFDRDALSSRFFYDAFPGMRLRHPVTDDTSDDRLAHSPNDRMYMLGGMSDTASNRITFERDSQYRITGVSHTDGIRLKLTYHASGYLKAIHRTDNGIQTLATYEQDARGRLTEADARLDYHLFYEYDAADRIIRWSDNDQTWSRFTYDEQGRCVNVTGAEGYYNATLDYGDGCTTVTDGKGIHRYYYDPDGNILREEAPDGSTTTYEWDEFHHLLARHSPAGRVEKFEYNAAHGQLSRYTAADGAEWQYRYDERGLLSNITDPAGQTWTQQCDEGFLRGKCVPRDLKVNETNAEYLLRKFDALEAKCAALENKIIPVPAELPPANESVLLFDANGEGWLIGWRSLWYTWGQKETGEWQWTFQVGDLENVNITHWAVMPKAPEAGA